MGKKKEKVVDLKPQKVSEQELNQMQGVVSAINKLKFDMGDLEAKKHHMLHMLFQGNEQLRAVQEDLEKKYGTADINVQDGSIKYKEDEPSDS
jgi:hypothetical protein|tara:strand:+ start:847 stop:1125 length:279 start_codon:yes stop_codon:yes gene_type:complete